MQSWRCVKRTLPTLLKRRHINQKISRCHGSVRVSFLPSADDGLQKERRLGKLAPEKIENVMKRNLLWIDPWEKNIRGRFYVSGQIIQWRDKFIVVLRRERNKTRRPNNCLIFFNAQQRCWWFSPFWVPGRRPLRHVWNMRAQFYSGWLARLGLSSIQGSGGIFLWAAS